MGRTFQGCNLGTFHTRSFGSFATDRTRNPPHIQQK
jgi:hypothetical protein